MPPCKSAGGDEPQESTGAYHAANPSRNVMLRLQGWKGNQRPDDRDQGRYKLPFLPLLGSLLNQLNIRLLVVHFDFPVGGFAALARLACNSFAACLPLPVPLATAARMLFNAPLMGLCIFCGLLISFPFD